MKYKIEIWRHHIIEDTYESNNIDDIVSWFKLNYAWSYDNGECNFEVYDDGVVLNFDEKYDLGFFS